MGRALRWNLDLWCLNETVPNFACISPHRDHIVWALLSEILRQSVPLSVQITIFLNHSLSHYQLSLSLWVPIALNGVPVFHLKSCISEFACHTYHYSKRIKNQMNPDLLSKLRSLPKVATTQPTLVIVVHTMLSIDCDVKCLPIEWVSCCYMKSESRVVHLFTWCLQNLNLLAVFVWKSHMFEYQYIITRCHYHIFYC